VDEHDNLDLEDTTHLLQEDTTKLHLNATQIVAAQLLGVLDDEPSLTQDKIEDKSKATISAEFGPLANSSGLPCESLFS